MKQLLCLFGAILVVGFLLYLKTFAGGWTLDDFPVIVNNPDVQSLAGFFENRYPGRPLREMTFLIDHALFGMNPAGWHVQQIFWHCLNAFLLFVLVVRLGGDRIAAGVATVFFLVHPIHVEVVANISNRKDSLALAFVLFSLLAYVQGIRTRKHLGWTAVALTFWGVAMAAKINAVVLPVLWLGYELAVVPPEQRFALRRHVGIKLCCVALLGVLAGVLFWFRTYGGYPAYLQAMNGVMAKMNHFLTGGDSLPYFLMVLKSLVFMAWRLVWPVNLAPEYAFSVPDGWSDPWVMTAVVAIAIYFILLVLTFRRAPRYFFALLWLGLFWLPVSNVFPLSYFAADRYFYAPTLGLALIVGFIAAQTVPGKRAIQVVLFVACGGLALLTWLQTDVWRSHETLWLQAVEVNPSSTTALNNLGGVYLQAGELEKAERYFLKATKNFNDPMPYYNLGRVYEKMGKKEAALRNYRYFLAFNPNGDSPLARKLKRRIYQRYGVLLQ